MNTATAAPKAEKAPKKPAQELQLRDEGGALAASGDQLPMATDLLSALVRAASDPRTDVAKIKELYALHKEEREHRAEIEFNEALARAQANLEPVRKNRDNTHTKSKYATLSAVLKVVQPAASAEGLSITFGTEKSEIQNCIRTTATLAHKGGHKVKYTLDLPLDKAGSQGTTNKTDIQAAASSLTYAQRILTKMIFWLSEENDEDGNTPTPVKNPMTDDHQATVTAKCQEHSPTQLSKVLRGYKAKTLAEIPDSEYDSIIARLQGAAK